MFKGPKPAGQPRTLRTIAETKNAGGGFPPPAPLPEDEWKGQYKDEAQSAAGGSKAAGTTPADPKPFKVRGA